MNVFIVYCHPSEDSFTYHVKEAFIKGLVDAGYSYTISDLYKMQFDSDMSEEEYLRDANYRDDLSIAQDVKLEQDKINKSDAIVFIYPVFWTDAPSKLVGWFGRVWTYGFAYGNRTMKKLDKALVLCVAGHTTEHLKQYGQYQSMETVMLGDRIFDRAKVSKMVVLDGTAKAYMESRQKNWDTHLKTAYDEAFSLFK